MSNLVLLGLICSRLKWYWENLAFLYWVEVRYSLKHPALHIHDDCQKQNCIEHLCTLPHLWIENNLSRNSQTNIAIMKNIPKHRTSRHLTQNLRDSHIQKHKKIRNHGRTQQKVWTYHINIFARLFTNNVILVMSSKAYISHFKPVLLSWAVLYDWAVHKIFFTRCAKSAICLAAFLTSSY